MESLEGKTMETQSSADVSTRLRRVAEAARRYRETPLTALSHDIDEDLLRVAYRLTRKDGAAGVDGETAQTYAANLEENLRSLCKRLHVGSYKAPPVRRVYIPKGDGTKTRPIGTPTFEDKVLQRAVTMVLSAVYEEEFYSFSYAFRHGRSQHQCLEALRDALMEFRGGWVIELDIRDCFGSLDHGVLRQFLDRRVRDGVLRRAIDKWLKAGVLEEGQLSYPEKGSPQGGVLSPLLSNIYLHEVLDTWFEGMATPVLEDEARMFRFADDAVLVFRSEQDARRVLRTLPKRFAKYELELHPEKTRLLRFISPRSPKRGRGDRATFEFLGFTHYWSVSRRGQWVVKRKTSRTRLRRALRAAWRWCRNHRHDPVVFQHRTLNAKLRGHYGYYGIVGNSRALNAYFVGVCRAWWRWLNRRCQWKQMPWWRFRQLLQRYPLLKPRIVHTSWQRRLPSYVASP